MTLKNKPVPFFPAISGVKQSDFSMNGKCNTYYFREPNGQLSLLKNMQ